jgi:hypothetical protein
MGRKKAPKYSFLDEEETAEENDPPGFVPWSNPSELQATGRITRTTQDPGTSGISSAGRPDAKAGAEVTTPRRRLPELIKQTPPGAVAKPGPGFDSEQGHDDDEFTIWEGNYEVEIGMSGKKDDKFYKDDEEEANKKCPPNHHVSRSNPNEVHKKGDTKQPSMESSNLKQEHVAFAQKDEEDIAMEEGVLSDEWEKAKEANDGHVPGSDPNEWGVSNEARKAAHGSSGGRRAVSSSRGRGPNASPGAKSRAHPPNHELKRPGAERVPGRGNEGLDEDEEQMTVVSREELILPILTEAERVDTEEEERRRQKEINQGINDFIATAAVADVVPDNRRKQRKFASVFMLLIVIAIGAVLGITLRTESLSPLSYGVLLSSVSSDNGTAVRNNLTSQYMAFNWTVTNDTTLRPDGQLIQRHALATLFYSTNGDSWTENEFWLTDSDQCNRWKGVACICHDEVSRLELVFNNLYGTLPPEIGLLSNLGKFIVEEICKAAVAHSLLASVRIHLVILMVCLDCLSRFSRSFGQFTTHWYDSI